MVSVKLISSAVTISNHSKKSKNNNKPAYVRYPVPPFSSLSVCVRIACALACALTSVNTCMDIVFILYFGGLYFYFFVIFDR